MDRPAYGGGERKGLRRRIVKMTPDQLARRRFERLVAEATAALPPEIRSRLENLDVVVEEQPSPETLAEAGMARGTSLYGYYQGVPQHHRGAWYGMTLPDKISIYRQPILADCTTWSDVRRLVRSTVWHEIAHHFGIDDDRLRKLGRD